MLCGIGVCLALAGANVARCEAEQAPTDHWAFRPLNPAPIPTANDPQWNTHPIDRFVAAHLEAKGYKPAPPASYPVLLRRIHLSLTGLPPSVEDQSRMEKLASESALDRKINQLLNQPAYGERWARHWLDVVRYADTNGYERDSEKPQAWRYRDYMIRSLNEDKPFDRLVIEQLAGDMLLDGDAETQIALGYYLVGPWDDEAANLEQARLDQLDDLVSTTSQAFLAMDFGCARCHHHKTDPISEADYYAFADIFSGIVRPIQDPKARPKRETVTPVGPYDQVQKARRIADRIDALRAKIQAMKEKVARGESMEASPIQRVSRPAIDGEQNEAMPAIPAPTEEANPTTLPEAEAELARLLKEMPDLPMAYVPRFRQAGIEPMHVLVRGDAGLKGEVVHARFPVCFDSILPRDSANPATRLELAQWLTDPRHPMVARVLVNRVWYHHFGQGLVRTVDDFGKTGDAPDQPELLDWLAHWFIHEARWSIKELHRLILTSRTYRMSQEGDPAQRQEDPDNRHWSRFPRRRCDVEVIHDGMLAASGQLNTRMFGDPVFPFLADEVKRSHEGALLTWKPFQETEASRRALYAIVKRSLSVPMFETLDRCECSRSTGQRSSTIGPAQALVSLNDEFVVRQARHLAKRIRREVGHDRFRQIQQAYRLVLGRAPTVEEASLGIAYLEGERAALMDERKMSPMEAEDQALDEFCRAMLNLNEFYFPD